MGVLLIGCGSGGGYETLVSALNADLDSLVSNEEVSEKEWKENDTYT